MSDIDFDDLADVSSAQSDTDLSDLAAAVLAAPPDGPK